MRPEYMRTDNVGFQRRIPVISRLPLGLVTALPVGLTPTARAPSWLARILEAVLSGVRRK